MPRLYREAPINTIWEGSGNVQCLDMLRAMQRNPQSYEAFMQELHGAQGKHGLMDQAIVDLQSEFADTRDIEYRSRQIVGKMALAMQASCLLQYGDALVADAFCQARLNRDNSGWVYGTLPKGVDCSALIKRAQPML